MSSEGEVHIYNAAPLAPLGKYFPLPFPFFLPIFFRVLMLNNEHRIIQYLHTPFILL